MDVMSLEDLEQMEIRHNSDWLDVDMSALICSTTVSPYRTKNSKHPSPTQDEN